MLQMLLFWTEDEPAEQNSYSTVIPVFLLWYAWPLTGILISHKKSSVESRMSS